MHYFFNEIFLHDIIWHHIFYYSIIYNWKFTSLFALILDKQQELDLPSLRIEDAVAATGSVDARAAKKKDRAQRGPAAMSKISGVKRPLTHTNSFTGERVPLHGVETPHEEELGKVSLWSLMPSSSPRVSRTHVVASLSRIWQAAQLISNSRVRKCKRGKILKNEINCKNAYRARTISHLSQNLRIVKRNVLVTERKRKDFIIQVESS